MMIPEYLYWIAIAILISFSFNLNSRLIDARVAIRNLTISNDFKENTNQKLRKALIAASENKTITLSEMLKIVAGIN